MDDVAHSINTEGPWELPLVTYRERECQLLWVHDIH